jgi:hypothetical protein
VKKQDVSSSRTAIAVYNTIIAHYNSRCGNKNDSYAALEFLQLLQ